jgi:misacylated tRNA(Ala) deacylase
MTQLLYHTDSYCKEFDARVTGFDAENRAVILDATAFYPGGGGQPCDFGTLAVNGTTYMVSKTKKQGADVLHFIEGDALHSSDALRSSDALPKVGDQVHGSIDWERRYQLMRTHTAMHILCGVVFRDYGAQVTGGDMDPLKGRMDFEFEHMQQELVREIEERINAEVAAARPVSVKILPREEAFAIPDLIRTKINLLPEGISEVRTVELSGLDLQADGGTHVNNTSEVGRLRVVDYKSKGKINKRIYLEVEP